MSFRHSFTLVELLIVIAIIGILATVSIVSLGGYTSKAKEAKITQNVVQFAGALNKEIAGGNDFDIANGDVAKRTNCTLKNSNTVARADFKFATR